jgi:hypothetical protein
VTFSKLSDDFGDDCWNLSDAAVRLHVEGLVWSGRKLLDCRIPVDDLRRFAKRPEAITELLAAGWWALDGDVYVIRHHAQYQRTREDVLNRQAVNTANGRKGGRPSKPPRERASEITAETQLVTDSLSDSRTEGERKGQDQEGKYYAPTRTRVNGEAYVDGDGHGTTCDCRQCEIDRAWLVEQEAAR